jgi:hypothetical protein
MKLFYIKSILSIALITLLGFNTTYADSPLTSTDFHKAYLDVPMVQKALNNRGKISNDLLNYISNESEPLDRKLAVINAIGWDIKGTQNSKLFMRYVLKRKKYRSDLGSNYGSFKWYATSDELICFAYLSALDDYFNVSDALKVANLALKKSPKSYAINMVVHLIKAQALFDIDEYCLAVKNFNTLKTNINLTMDMRKEAERYIFEYMDYSNSGCNKI